MMNILPLSVLTGFVLAAAISAAAFRVRSLSPRGAVAAALLGTIIFGLGGLGWAVLLLVFFISSSLLSRLFRRRKAAFEEKFSKGSRRDAGQVLANGGIAGAFVLLHIFFPQASWPWVAFACALAAANADTWATELGVLSRSAPRLSTTGRPVEPGTSGGISALGLLAALSGAFMIALPAVLFWQGRVLNLAGNSPDWLAALVGSAFPAPSLPQSLIWLVIVSLAGLAGSLLDSFLGATVQAIYTCPTCQKETERNPLHTCGTQTTFLRGWRWMNNDWVNLFCTLLGGLIGLLAALLI